MDKLKEEITFQSPSARVAVLPVDIQNYKDVDKSVEAAAAEFGSIDILVNNVSFLLPYANTF